MCSQHDADEDGDQTKNMARIIFDTALLESGYDLASPKDFNQRIYEVLGQGLKTKVDFTKGSEFDAEVSLRKRMLHKQMKMLWLYFPKLALATSIV